MISSRGGRGRSSPGCREVRDAAPGGTGGTLGGLRVLVTRPPQRARSLCAELRRRGALPVPLPAIEIAAARNLRALREAMAGLDRYDLAVFVSPSAVEHALALAPSGWPGTLRAAAIGPGTRAALARCGIEPAFVPAEPFDSEALLRCPELAADRVAGARIALFKGEGGREHLARELRRRGARVEEVETYRRQRPRDLESRLRCSPVPDLVVLTSAEAARNLLGAAAREGAPRLAAAHFVVISERVADALRELGAEGPASVAPRASEAGLIEAMEAWAAGRR